MAVKSMRDRYGTLAVAIYWLTVMRRRVAQKPAQFGICQYPTVRRPFGYSLYLTATVLFSATAVYAQGMPSNCRRGWIDAGQTKQGWVCNSPSGQSNCRWGWIDADQTKQGWVCNSTR